MPYKKEDILQTHYLKCISVNENVYTFVKIPCSVLN